MIFDAQRPVILNGIEEPAKESDLMDRALLLCLPVIPEEKRQTEEEFWCAFEKARPRILGAILTAMSAALRNLPTVKLDALPRMADLAKFAVAAEPALGLSKGAFMQAYTCNRAEANELVLESDPVAVHLRNLVRTKSWEGSASDLLGAINKLASEAEKHSKFWPQKPRALSNQLTRLQPNLRKAGIAVTRSRENSKRLIKLENIGLLPSPACPALQGREDRDEAGDDGDDGVTITGTEA
jgi:hypothetical protein